MEAWKNLSLENMSEIVDGVLCIEEWKWVNHCEGRYQASTFGRLKSFCKGGISIRKQVPRRDDYTHLQLWIDDKVKSLLTHRIIADTFIPNPENKPEVNHKKGNRKDNRVWMIEWSTSSENAEHAYKELGKASNLKRGENNINAKLTPDKVRRIRKIYSDGRATMEEIANAYGISKTGVGKIILRRIWKHVN